MGSSTDITNLLPQLYQAASGECEWEPFLTGCSQALGAASGVIVVDQALVGTYRVDQDYVDKYAGYYAAKNVYFQRAGHRLQEGMVMQGEELCPNSELEKSEYFNEYLVPQDIYHSLATVPQRDAVHTVHLGFVRPKRRGAFEASEVERLRWLVPHLRSAVRIRERFQELRFRDAALLEALNRLRVAVFLLDGSGRVLSSNNAAGSLLARRDGLAIVKGRLAAACRKEDVRLSRSIQNAIAVYRGAHGWGDCTVCVSRSSDLRAYVACVAPLRMAGAFGSASSIAAAVFVSDPSAEGAERSAIWREQYSFTPAEMRLASLLLSGKSVQEAADFLHVTTNTTRTQLKSIMSKTGTRRQSELIRVLLASSVIQSSF